MYSRILVPIDTSHATNSWLQPTLREAGELAAKPDGLIHIMSVIPQNLLHGEYPNLYTEELVAQAKRKLEDIATKHYPANPKIVVCVAEGGVCSEIVKMAREQSIDVIVMASHGPLIKDYLLGSKAAHVALHAPCSVFVIRDAN